MKGWYTALAEQMKGLYYMDGGPITLVQVDNETSDWKFLLALRELGLSLGITPCSYTKTGWPSPAAGYPADYPMLPFFGGYPDQFWSNDMHSDASLGAYMMHAGGGGVAAKTPMLGVEIGGGMAADCAAPSLFHQAPLRHLVSPPSLPANRADRVLLRGLCFRQSPGPFVVSGHAVDAPLRRGERLRDAWLLHVPRREQSTLADMEPGSGSPEYHNAGVVFPAVGSGQPDAVRVL